MQKSSPNLTDRVRVVSAMNPLSFGLYVTVILLFIQVAFLLVLTMMEQQNPLGSFFQDFLLVSSREC